jgi:hypothetical protein
MTWTDVVTMQFQDAEIGTYQSQKGYLWLAEWLILTTDLSNKEIAIVSEVSRRRISPLRRKLRL